MTAITKYIRQDISGILILLTGLMIILLTAPKSLPGQEVESREVIVEAAYQPEVPDAEKIHVTPRLPEFTPDRPEGELPLLGKKPETPFRFGDIKPARIESERAETLYRNFLRAGVGNYATALVDFYAGSLRSKKSSVDMRISHRSSSGKMKEVAFPGNSRSKIGLTGSRYFSRTTLSGYAGYDRKTVHYYGFSPDSLPELDLKKSDYRQVFNQVSAGIKLSNNKMSSYRPDFATQFDYNLLTDRFSTREHKLHYRGSVSSSVQLLPFSEEEHIDFNLDAPVYINSDSLTSSTTSGIVRMNPVYRFSFNQYSFKIGADVPVRFDSVTHTHVFPDIEAQVKVAGLKLVTFAGIGGKVVRSGYNRLRNENPFVSPIVPLGFTVYKSMQYGGLKGYIGRYFDYRLQFTNFTVDRMPFFVADTTAPWGRPLYNQFTVVYDRVKLTRLAGEFGWRMSGLLQLNLMVQYDSWFLDELDYPWHKPRLNIRFEGDYRYSEQIDLSAALYVRGAMYAPEVTAGSDVTNAVKLNPAVDLRVAGSYHFTPELSAFLEINNLLGQRYELWNHYPGYRLNAVAGVGYSF